MSETVKISGVIITFNEERHIEACIRSMQAVVDEVLVVDSFSTDRTVELSEAMGNWQGGAYQFNRLNNYCGAWLKRSWYPDKKTRLWDRRQGAWGGTNPHDRVVMTAGSIKRVKGDIIHYAYGDLEEHFKQVTKFAIIAANAKFEQGKKASFLIHVLIGPVFKFVKRYVFRFGFLDGYYGFIFSALAAYVNFMKYLRLWELNKNAKRK